MMKKINESKKKGNEMTEDVKEEGANPKGGESLRQKSKEVPHKKAMDLCSKCLFLKKGKEYCKWHLNVNRIIPMIISKGTCKQFKEKGERKRKG